MKALFLTLAMVVSTQVVSASNCGSVTVAWPSDLKRNCGDQLIYNGGAAIGQRALVSDTLGGNARYICTAEGWNIEESFCGVARDYACIASRLKALDSVYYADNSKTTESQILEILNDSQHPKRSQYVQAANSCN